MKKWGVAIIDVAMMRALCIVVFIGATPASQAQMLDQQERCAASARRAYSEDNEEAETKVRVLSSKYVSHYNKKRNRCLILVTKVTSMDGRIGTEMYLADAIEQREYAYFLEEDGKLLSCT